MTRAQLMAVLDKHVVRVFCQKFCCKGKGMSDCDSLLTDLLAVQPQPSREGLEKILFPYAEPAGYSAGNNWLIDKIMAWATATPPTWCRHLDLREFVTIDVSGETRKMHRDNLRACPICGTPRLRARELLRRSDGR